MPHSGRVVLVTAALMVLAGAHVLAETLFYDEFDRKELGDNYITEYQRGVAGKPSWVIEQGVLKQTEPSQMGDSAYAILVDQDYPAQITVKARMRIDSWVAGDGARCGVAVRVMLDNDGSAEGDGYTFLVHNALSTIQFLNDLKAWGTQGNFTFEVGKWYWMQLEIDADDVLHGKAWADGDKEPAKPLLDQDTKVGFGNFERKEGYPGLNGGAQRGGEVTVSFDNVEVWDKDGSTLAQFLAVQPAGKLVTAWGRIKSMR